MVIGVNEHAPSFTTSKMTAAEWSVSGSPANFRGRTMGALNAPAKVVSQCYIPHRYARPVAAKCVNLIFWASINATRPTWPTDSRCSPRRRINDRAQWWREGKKNGNITRHEDRFSARNITMWDDIVVETEEETGSKNCALRFAEKINR